MALKRRTAYEVAEMEEEVERHWHEVLVVEDEGDIRDAIAHLLDFQAFTVKSATDGQQAIAELREGYRPCVILLDLTMPNMDGISFRSEQKQLNGCADIPVVIVSGHADGKEVAASLEAREFLKKPVRIPTLLAAVEGHCARAAQRK